jgi:hypothetical protein
MLCEIFVYDQTFYLHFFQMLHLHHRVVVDVHHLDVAVHQLLVHRFLEYLIYMVNYLALQCAAQNHQYHLVLRCAVRQDVLQNLDVLNLDVNQPFQNVVVLLENLEVFVVDVEQRHLLKMDCYLDVVQVLPEQQAMMELSQSVLIHRR